MEANAQPSRYSHSALATKLGSESVAGASQCFPALLQLLADKLSNSRRNSPSFANAKNLTAGFAGLVLFFSTALSIEAANFRTQNFLVQAPTAQLAQSVGQAAEQYRDDLATYWTGKTLPPWPSPCPIRVVAGNLAAQGVTTYNPAPVRDFQMEVIGTPERILDSVLPHEVTHTVLATYFGRPLPRWADEGICTTVEHASEKAKHEAKLREFLSTRRGIAMNRLFLLTEYPQDVLPMYAQGYSVCRFLIEQQGPQTFIQFLKDYMRQPSWTTNVQKHYGYESLAELQKYWLGWVEAGSGPVARFAKVDRNTPADGSLGARIALANLREPANHTVPVGSARKRARDIAPATALAAASMPNRAGGSASWYQRNASDRSSSATAPARDNREIDSLAAVAPATQIASLEMLPPGRRELANSQREPSTNGSSSRLASPGWAPPSVLSSGRYSAATQQPEHSGSMRSSFRVQSDDSPKLNGDRIQIPQQTDSAANEPELPKELRGIALRLPRQGERVDSLRFNRWR